MAGLPSFTGMTGAPPPHRPASATSRPAAGGRLGPNLPYLLVTVIAGSALTGYLLFAEPFTDGPETTSSLVAVSTTGTPETTLPGAPSTTTQGTGTTQPVLSPDAGPLQGLALQTLATGIPFPVFAASIPGDQRVFVLERQGRVRLIDPDLGLLETPYLNLLDRVGSGGIENGLLGMAFHPDFAANGRLFVYYTDASLNSKVSEFQADGVDTPTVSASTERVILEVPQSGIRHRAGMLQFGPDGYLYIALGDGGMGDHAAQDLTTHQGSILRIDIDSGDPYAIPADNPFAAGGGLAEIWAYGLRNPWRFSIDDGLIYIGDVGQSEWEEINVQPLTSAGLDYGWPNFEGTSCYKPTDGCEMTGWVAPTLAYTHEEGCSVTGGYVYRGVSIPELGGHYFYADWCNGWIRSFRYEGGEALDQQDWSEDLDGAGQVSSFGIDGSGELLVVDSNGSVHRVVAER